jgi:hypothetical protein
MRGGGAEEIGEGGGDRASGEEAGGRGGGDTEAGRGGDVERRANDAAWGKGGEERSRDGEEIDAVRYGNRMVEIARVCQMRLLCQESRPPLQIF